MVALSKKNSPVLSKPRKLNDLNARKTIMIADDEPSLCYLYKAGLKSRYSVETYSCGIEAMARLDRKPPLGLDLIILDYHLAPKICGLDLAKITKKRYPKIPIALCTGSPYFQNGDLDGIRVIKKPFPISSLIHYVRNELG